MKRDRKLALLAKIKAREIESSALPATCEQRYVAEVRATNERRNTIGEPRGAKPLDPIARQD